MGKDQASGGRTKERTVLVHTSTRSSSNKLRMKDLGHSDAECLSNAHRCGQSTEYSSSMNPDIYDPSPEQDTSHKPNQNTPSSQKRDTADTDTAQHEMAIPRSTSTPLSHPHQTSAKGPSSDQLTGSGASSPISRWGCPNDVPSPPNRDEQEPMSPRQNDLQ